MQFHLEEAIQNLLVCPSCRHKLSSKFDRLTCAVCKLSYPIRNDIVHFFSDSHAESGAGESKSQEYRKKYQEISSAINYNRKYQQRQKRRTRRETRIIRELLASMRPIDSILDLPCGGGRLSPLLAENSRVLIEADIAIGQLLYAQENSRLQIPRMWLRASALQIPLSDASVDAALCLRLCHHFHTPEERENLVRELLRVARRFVILSFVSSNSPKNIWRRCWRRSKSNTMSGFEIAAIAATAGAKLVAAPAIAPLRSHCYALLQKKRSPKRYIDFCPETHLMQNTAPAESRSPTSM